MCPKCTKKVDSLKSAIKNDRVLSERCEECLANYSRISDLARKYNRDRGRRDYGKDILQRFEGTEINPAFVDAYPKESAEQWGPEVLRDYGIKRKRF